MIGSRAGEGLLMVPYWDRWVTNCKTVQSELLFTLSSEWRGCDRAVLMRTWNQFSWLINRASPPSGGIYSVTGECILCTFSVSSESGPAKGNHFLGQWLWHSVKEKPLGAGSHRPLFWEWREDCQARTALALLAPAMVSVTLCSV